MMAVKMSFVEPKTEWEEIGRKLAKITRNKSLRIKGSISEVRKIQKGVYFYAKTRLTFSIRTKIENGGKVLIISRV